MFKINPLHAIDAYKLSHRPAYPEGTSEVYSNFTPRSVKHLDVPQQYKSNNIVWFGGQAAINDMIEQWDEEFFKQPLDEVINTYSRRIAPFSGSEYSVDHIKELHTLGYLPLEIKTLPEGLLVPVGVPVMTVRNTLPRFFWLTNYIETYLSAELWKMSTSATIAYYYRKIIEHWADKTGGNKDFIDFQAHDFSCRGMSGMLDAAKSGAGHLLSFKGTDSIVAADYLEYHYNGDQTFIGASVPATEHSIQCAFSNDEEYIRRIVTEVYPNGIVSVVSDGYDYWNVITNILPKLKDEILARGEDELGMSKVVIRPDSGDPVRIIAGYTYWDLSDADVSKFDLYSFVQKLWWDDLLYSKDHIIKLGDKYFEFVGSVDFNLQLSNVNVVLGKELSEAEVKGSIQCLWDIFGGTVNNEGFKTLNSKIGLIYGDSITTHRADKILKLLSEKGFASDNVVFGIGSFTYQYNTRDTLGFAMKATNITVNAVDIPLFKNPKTDDGTKKSAKGLLMVDENLVLHDNVSRENEQNGLLKILYKDGSFYMSHIESLETIRERLKNGS